MNTTVPCIKSRLRHFGAALPAQCASFLSRRALWSPVIALLLSGAPALCQTLEWVNQPLAATPFGDNDEGRAIARDVLGNVYITGSFRGTADFDPGPGTANLSSAGFQDIFIAKYDASGNYLWARQIGSVSEDIGYGIAVDGSGNVHVTGYFMGTADFNPGAGTANLTSLGGTPDIFIAKYDASGNFLWANKVGDTGTDIGYGIALDGNGNVHVTGFFMGTTDFDPGAGTANLTSPGGNLDIFIAKYDASGNYLWANQVGSTGTDIGYGLAVDGSGNVHVTGYFQGSNVDFNPGAGTANLSSNGGNSDIFIAKYDVSGNYLWANRIGGTSSDEGYGLAVDGSGNVHVTGYFQGSNVDFDPGAGTANRSSAGNHDIFIAKYDASGNYLWASQIGGFNTDDGYGLALDGSGNVLVTGSYAGSNVDFDPGAGTANLSSAGNIDVFVAKYDVSGNYVWAKGAGSAIARGHGLTVDGSGNVHVTGYFRGSNADFDPGAGTANLSSGFSNQDVFAWRLSSAGDYGWAINLGNAGSQPSSMICRAIARDASGNVYATGSFAGSKVDFDPGAGAANLSSTDGSDIFIAKYNPSGNYLWAIRIGGTSGDGGYGLAVDGSGNVHVTGYFTGTVDFDPGPGTAFLSSVGFGGDMFIAKYDASGNFVWAKHGAAGASNTDGGNGIALDGSGNVFVTGFFRGNNVDFDPGAGTANLNSAGNEDIFIAKYDASGNYLWAKRVGGSNGDVGYAIAVDGSGNVHVTGLFSSSNVDFDPGAGTANLSAGGQDIFVAKYDASGNYVWAIRIGGPNSDAGAGLALDGSGNVYVTGEFQGTSNVDFDPGAGTANLITSYQDIFIAKYDASGNYVWAKQLGGSGADVGFGLALDGNGNVCVTGTFAGSDADFDPGAGTANLTSTGGQDIFIAKYDASGNYVWAISAGGNSSDYGYCIAAGGADKVNAGGTFFGTVDFDPGAGTANRTAVTSNSDIFIAQYGPPPPAEFKGTILWEHDDSGVQNATVNLTGAASGSDQTDVDGDFLITTNIPAGNFTLKPVKNTNKLNGVTVGDATAIQQHVTFINVITDPYKLVCADVNKSNSITTLDASLIKQCLLGNSSANNIFNTSWRFVPTSHTMTNPPWNFPEQRTYTAVSGTQIDQDFIGMKIGDVTGDANPASLGSSGLVLTLRDQRLEAGKTIDVEVETGQAIDLAAFQFALGFDPDQLELLSVEPLGGLPLSADNFGLYNRDNGEIRVVWSQATGLDMPAPAPAFRLQFMPLQSGASLSDVLHLDEAALPARAYNSQLVESGVELRVAQATGTTAADPSALQMQVRPNPFRAETTVSFALPEAGEAELRVLDVNGRELLRVRKTYPAGTNSETLRLEATGVLTCALVTPFGVVSRRLVAVR